MQPSITKRESATPDFRRIELIYHEQTIVSVSQIIRSKVDAKPRLAEVNWGAMSSTTFEQVEALGHALLEAVAIAREWSQIVEENG